MVFFMRCLRNSKVSRRKHYIQAGLLAFLLGSNLLCYAEPIEVKHVDFVLRDGRYYLDAKLKFELNKEIRNALDHGIKIHINSQFQLSELQSWLWAKLVSKRALNLELQYHPISNRYVAGFSFQNRPRTFRALDSALDYLGDIGGLIFFDSLIVKPSKEYIAELKVFIDVETLPAPMRPVAYISSRWRDFKIVHRWEAFR